MKITLSPQRREDRLDLSATGDVLTINGTPYDFGPVPEGATLPGDAVDSDWVVGDVTRVNGELHLTLILPHGPNAPEATRFPEPITVTKDGPVDLPAYDEEPQE